MAIFFSYTKLKLVGSNGINSVFLRLICDSCSFDSFFNLWLVHSPKRTENCYMNTYQGRRLSWRNRYVSAHARAFLSQKNAGTAGRLNRALIAPMPTDRTDCYRLTDWFCMSRGDRLITMEFVAQLNPSPLLSGKIHLNAYTVFSGMRAPNSSLHLLLNRKHSHRNNIITHFEYCTEKNI